MDKHVFKFGGHDGLSNRSMCIYCDMPEAIRDDFSPYCYARTKTPENYIIEL